MAVLPEHQRQGLGDVMLKKLLSHIEENAAVGEVAVTLIADPPGRKLYDKNGFKEVAERDETGMLFLLDKKAATLA